LEHRDLIVAMTGNDLSALPAYGLAFLLPFLVSLTLARRGHARTAWWLPGGIAAMSVLFVGMGLVLGQEMQTGPGAAMSLGLLSVPAIIGGVAGILIGRRRA
jgi:hypothetical protein